MGYTKTVKTANNDDIIDLSNVNDIYGSDGNDRLTGSKGNDRLYGGAGDDYLDGGAGNDYLEGGKGNDTYVFSKGHGHDTISDMDYTDIYDQKPPRIDTIQFTDVNFAEVRFRREGYNLILEGYHEGDSIVIEFFFYDQSCEIEKFVFQDQTIYLSDVKKNGLVFYGTDEQDSIMWSGQSEVYAGAGNDHIKTGIYDDILDGGTGDDYLYGGDGNDTYIFYKGHGKDWIYDEGLLNSSNDTIRFTDVKLAEVQFRKEGKDLIIFGYHEGDSITIAQFFDSNYRIENFIFQDQTINWNYFNQNPLVIEGTDEDDYLQAAEESSCIIYGGNGNDTIYGKDFDDILYGGTGDDKLYGGYGNDHLIGGDGNDLLVGEDGDDILEGGDGDDNLYGGNGNDILIGGLGNDDLNGGCGQDTYIFSKGHGHDRIYDFASEAEYYTNTSNDTIKFTDVNFSEIHFRKEGDDLVIAGYHEGDSIHISSFFYSDWARIENFVFKDRTITLAELIQNGLIPQDTAEDDEYVEWRGRSLIHTDEGDNSLYANSGSHDLLIHTISTDEYVTIDDWYKNDNNQKFAIITADEQAVVTTQVQQLIMVMNTFTADNNYSLLPDQMQQFIQQNNFSSFWSS